MTGVLEYRHIDTFVNGYIHIPLTGVGVTLFSPGNPGNHNDRTAAQA